MLALSRKVGESIYIGNDIKIQVIRNGRNHVVLGIDAPKHIPILRQELKRDERRESATED